MAGPTDPYLTLTEAAERLGISRQTVERRIAAGELSGRRIAGRLVVRRTSVEAYEQRQSQDRAA